MYDMEIHQKMRMPKYQKLKTMVKRSVDQKLRLRNFVARQDRIGTRAVVKSRNGLSGVEGGKWKEKGQRPKGNHAVSSMRVTIVHNKKTNPNAATPSGPSMTRGRSVSRKRSIKGQKQSWYHSSTTVQILFERYLHEIAL